MHVMQLSPLVPGVATTRTDDSGAWRPSSRRDAAPPTEVHSMSETASEPSFVGEMLNMTVPVGRDVDLDCQVKNAEGYKVRNAFAMDFCFLRECFPTMPVQCRVACISTFVRSSSHVLAACHCHTAYAAHPRPIPL